MGKSNLQEVGNGWNRFIWEEALNALFAHSALHSPGTESNL